MAMSSSGKDFKPAVSIVGMDEICARECVQTFPHDTNHFETCEELFINKLKTSNNDV